MKFKKELKLDNLKYIITKNDILTSKKDSNIYF